MTDFSKSLHKSLGHYRAKRESYFQQNPKSTFIPWEYKSVINHDRRTDMISRNEEALQAVKRKRKCWRSKLFQCHSSNDHSSSSNKSHFQVSTGEQDVIKWKQKLYEQRLNQEETVHQSITKTTAKHHSRKRRKIRVTIDVFYFDWILKWYKNLYHLGFFTS